MNNIDLITHMDISIKYSPYYIEMLLNMDYINYMDYIKFKKIEIKIFLFVNN